MKTFARAFAALLALLAVAGCAQEPASSAAALLQDGDVLFQSLPHPPLVDVIEGCTHSPYSHCGLAHRTVHGWVVIEAIGPGKETPLAAWIAQARDGRFSVYRLRQPFHAHISAMIAAAQ